MADKSAIEWTESTWNPTTGCDRISSGCDNCYALTLAKRLKSMGSAKYQGDGDPRTSGPGFGLALHPDSVDLPRRWKSPRLVFVNSMSDLFHAKVPFHFVLNVVTTMRETPQHTYQLLTKRTRRLRMLSRDIDWPDNVWVGTSVETTKELHRIEELAQVDAAVRFLSLEPLLGPLPELDLTGIDWVIVGGESGAHARPMDPDWVRELRDAAVAQDVPFFFKQWGGRTPKSGGRELDGRTWNQMPARSVSPQPNSAGLGKPA
jgi:protein gp37